jgi:hypothetical protein
MKDTAKNELLRVHSETCFRITNHVPSNGVWTATIRHLLCDVKVYGFSKPLVAYRSFESIRLDEVDAAEADKYLDMASKYVETLNYKTSINRAIYHVVSGATACYGFTDGFVKRNATNHDRLRLSGTNLFGMQIFVLLSPLSPECVQHALELYVYSIVDNAWFQCFVETANGVSSVIHHIEWRKCTPKPPEGEVALIGFMRKDCRLDRAIKTLFSKLM